MCANQTRVPDGALLCARRDVYVRINQREYLTELFLLPAFREHPMRTMDKEVRAIVCTCISLIGMLRLVSLCVFCLKSLPVHIPRPTFSIIVSCGVRLSDGHFMQVADSVFAESESFHHRVCAWHGNDGYAQHKKFMRACWEISRLVSEI